MTSVAWVDAGNAGWELLEEDVPTEPFGVAILLADSTERRLLVGLWGGGCPPEVSLAVVEADQANVRLTVVIDHALAPPEPIACGDLQQAWVVELQLDRPVAVDAIDLQLNDRRITSQRP